MKNQFSVSQKFKTVKKALYSPAATISARVAIAALAVAFIILGIFNGGIGDVLKKAINICTECIGMG